MTAQSGSYVTVVTAKSNNNYCKTFTPDGQTTSAARGSRIARVDCVPVKGTKKLAKLLRELCVDPRRYVVFGAPLVVAPTRRCADELGGAVSYLCIDIDNLKLPKKLRTSAYTEEHARYAVERTLPSEFSGVSCVWTASSSAGLDPKVLKLHLWYLLDEPLTPSAAQAWLRPVEAIDPATLSTAQLIYTAAPVGAESFYDGERVGVLSGPLKRVSVPRDIVARPKTREVAADVAPRAADGRSADVTDEQLAATEAKARKRAKAVFKSCAAGEESGYKAAYVIGTILGPVVAQETWNDVEGGHEAWKAARGAEVAAWGRRIAELPGATHNAETYAARVREGIAYGVANERFRLTCVPSGGSAALAKILRSVKPGASRTKLVSAAGRMKKAGVDEDSAKRALTDAALCAPQEAHSAWEEAPDAEAWETKLVRSGKDDAVKACAHNYRIIFEEHPLFLTSFKMNVRTNELQLTDANVFGEPSGPVSYDVLPYLLLKWLADVCGCTDATISGPFEVFRAMVGNIETFDPFLQMFPEALMKRKAARKYVVDEPKLDTWLIDYFGAEDTPYVRAAGARALIGAVARAVEPGAKVDTMLVLVGAQGLGKTSVLNTLGSVIERGYSELITMTDRDSLMAIQSAVVVEVSELRALRGTAEEHAKAFLTRQHDRFRAPYARSVVEYPRRMVFVGTTNDDEFLTDTVNRRYWPVTVTSRCFLTHEDAVVLWREAAVRYARGEQWWLDEPELIDAQKAATMQAREEDTLEAPLDALVEGKERVFMADLLNALNPTDPRDMRTAWRVGRLLRARGWGKVSYGRKAWVRGAH